MELSEAILRTVVAQWLTHRATDPRDTGLIPRHGGRFSDGGKMRKRQCVSRFRRTFKIPRWSKLIGSPPLWRAS